MVIPSPTELGMPAKFTAWRSSQEEAIRYLLTSTKRVKALCAPTGFGKTAVYMAYALITGEPTCFVTDSRALQDQLMDDYAPIGLVDLRGRRNYTCPIKEDYTCEDGYQASCPYKGSIQCPSSQAEMRAATSRLVDTNYDKWTASKRFGKGMQHFTQVVFDEGHQAPEALGRAMQVTLHEREITQTLEVPFPDTGLNEMERWKRWAVLARAVAEGKLKAAQERLKGTSAPSAGLVRHTLHMRNLTRRLSILATARPVDWVVEEGYKSFIFDPIFPGRYAESTLLLRVPNIIILSATLRPKTLALMGIAQEHYDFREFSSDFDPKRGPIYWVPTMRVDYKAESLAPMWNQLDRIASARQDRKGIVHTISYARRDDIISRSRFASHMFINERGEPSTDMVDQFKRSGPGAILVSPSVGAGFDFPYRDCEWQFVSKVPFPPPSKILKARTASDPAYPYYLAMQKLVQMFGRGMRSRDDRCENFIVDDHFGEWFYPRWSHLAPKWFHGFVQRADVLPQPPPPL